MSRFHFDSRVDFFFSSSGDPPQSSPIAQTPNSVVTVGHQSTSSLVSSIIQSAASSSITGSTITFSGNIQAATSSTASQSSPSASATLINTVPPSSKGHSAGKIAGVVVGILIAVGVLLLAAFIVYRRRRRRRPAVSRPTPFPAEQPEAAGKEIQDLVEQLRAFEERFTRLEATRSSSSNVRRTATNVTSPPTYAE
ncbi:hypothetical protein FB45DRAFT_354235 [Roridomyces roridus]|uniref:Mid2 domain-containing protein n=1 Tax=Roridomyces roridus TaxID=1738132 RepID=A0AAD7C796_9AGAR|nr:hypothetical protein FB45DRAFT_354235 [Roridomyces roridus]